MNMDFDQAILDRHSVRQYEPRELGQDVLQKLQAEIDRINQESGLIIKLYTNEPKAFGGLLLKTTVHFRGAVNYFAVSGPESPDLNWKAGYYGEILVLYAQTLGLNTCWALLAGKKEAKSDLDEGYRNVISISVGYGENQGRQHKNRPVEEVADLEGAPDWFIRGVNCAMLAPTGRNRQAFRFEREGDKVRLITGNSTLSQIDKGIVRFHFEYGAGKDNFTWIE